MPTVRDILDSKGSTVHSVGPAQTVLEATQRMNQHKIGAVVVVHEGHLLGIFTERDILTRVIGQGVDPSRTTVAEVMTNDPITVTPDTDLDEIAALMQQKRIRHVPVCDNSGSLAGLISIGDVNAWHASSQEATIHALSDYIHGRV
jgi:CBS domain-containing protein